MVSTASLKAPKLLDLRARVRSLERQGTDPAPRLPLGIAALDEALPGGGLALAGLHEILPQRAEWDDGPAAGFCLTLAARIPAVLLILALLA
ncbi:MAG: hypothetical protein WD100_04695, partial [Tistlia sp.]